MDKACSKTSLIAAPTTISRTISLNCSQSCSGRDGGASALTARRHRASQGGVSRGTADQSPIGGAGPSTLPAAPTSDRYENRCVPAASRQRAGRSWCARGRGGRYSATITVRPASRPRLRSPTAAPRSGSHSLLMGQRSGGRGRLGGFRRGRWTGTHLPEPVERSLGSRRAGNRPASINWSPLMRRNGRSSRACTRRTRLDLPELDAPFKTITKPAVGGGGSMFTRLIVAPADGVRRSAARVPPPARSCVEHYGAPDPSCAEVENGACRMTWSPPAELDHAYP